MIWLFYAFLLLGLVLLGLDVADRLRVAPERARWWRWIGIAAAAGPGLAPLLAWLTGQLSVSWPFPLIALAYLAFFAAFAVGALGWLGVSVSLWLRRAGYLGLLILAALPSWVLLLLTPLVAIAGLGLSRPRSDPA